MRNASLLATFLVATWIGASAKAEIVFTGDEADVTFYYQSQVGVGGTWHTVFRAKGTEGSPTDAEATGLTTPFNGFTGIVGNVVPAVPGNTGDYSFNSLRTNLVTSTIATVGSTGYYVSTADGSPFNPPSSMATADLGIRMRLRENQAALGIGADIAANQFDSFNLTLDLNNSTFNGSALAGNANVSLLGWDSFNAPVALIDTSVGSLTENFGNYVHFHRNFGFSEFGEYNLAFQIQGVAGTYGATAATGNFNMGFNVTAVPEPATTGLLAAGFGCVALGRRFRRKKEITESTEGEDLAVIS